MAASADADAAAWATWPPDGGCRGGRATLPAPALRVGRSAVLWPPPPTDAASHAPGRRPACAAATRRDAAAARDAGRPGRDSRRHGAGVPRRGPPPDVCGVPQPAEHGWRRGAADRAAARGGGVPVGVHPPLWARLPRRVRVTVGGSGGRRRVVSRVPKGGGGGRERRGGTDRGWGEGWCAHCGGCCRGGGRWLGGGDWDECRGGRGTRRRAWGGAECASSGIRTGLRWLAGRRLLWLTLCVVIILFASLAAYLRATV